MRDLLRISSTLAILAVACGPVWAGWITIRNDTTQELVVQDVFVVNGKVKTGKAVKLLPGESVREFQPKAGSRLMHIYEAAKLKTPLAKSTLEWEKDDVTFSIQTEKNVTNVAIVPPPQKKP